MHRRRFMEVSAAAVLASASNQSSGLAWQKATPVTSPIPAISPDADLTLEEQVTRLPPRSLLEALLATPVTTPLFPADIPPIEPVEWDDGSDTDLAGTVGAVVFNTGYDANRNYLPVGDAMVFPDSASAEARITGMVSAPERFLGMPWAVQSEYDSAVSVLRIGYLILVGGTQLPVDQVAVASPSEADPRQVARMTSRAIIRMTALTDHLRDVLAQVE